MKYVSIRKNKYAVYFTAGFGVLFAIAAVLSTLNLFVRGIFELLAVIFVVTMIQIWQRYLMSYYEYILDPDDELIEHNRLTVVQVVGKRRTSVYTVPLSGLDEVIPYEKMRSIEKKYGKIGKKMSFCADMLPKESYLLIFENEDDLVLIRLQCDAAFLSSIKERAGI